MENARTCSPTAAAPPISVAIVGCGIGGAGLALALQTRGFHVRVFERDESFSSRTQGYGLTMQQGNKALDAIGLTNTVRGISSSAHFSFLPDGSLIGAFGRSLYASCVERDRTAAAAAASATAGMANSTQSTDGADQSDQRRKRRRFNIHLPREELRSALVSGISPE
jgi:2-polyprenyl-6-methoxyphenol hydroxylase-like FAD-dependent oxidoreductase